MDGGRAWAGQDPSRGGHALREPPETGSVIPGTLPALTDRACQSIAQTFLSTDSGPDDDNGAAFLGAH